MISSAEYLTEDEWDDLDAVSPPLPGGGQKVAREAEEKEEERVEVRSIKQIPIIRGKLTFRVRRDPSTAINDRNCATSDSTR